MKKQWILLALVVVVAVVALFSGQSTGLTHQYNYVGLWEGIDPLDGFESAISIYPADYGTYTISHRSGYYSFCSSSDPDIDGFGLFVAEGRIIEGVLVSNDRALECASGEVVNIPADYILDPEHDLLTMDLRGFRESVVYHRISSNPYW